MLKIECANKFRVTQRRQVKIKIEIFYFLPSGNIKMGAVTMFFFLSLLYRIDISFFLVKTKEYNKSF